MSSLMRVKLWRDIRASWSRFVLMVVAVMVSLSVFGGVLFAWAAVGRETSGAYLGTGPASATIVLEQGVSVDEMESLAAEVRGWPEVVEATGRSQFNSDVEVDGIARDIPLQVFVTAPDDPLRMARFYVEDGVWPAEEGEIFLGGDSLALLDVTAGDIMTVIPPSGEPMRLQIAGTVYDPSLSPSPQEQTARGYLSATSLTTSGSALLDQLKVQISSPGETIPSDDRGRIVEVAGDIGLWLQTEHGLTVAEIQVPEPHTHPHQFQADSLLLSLLAGGVAALILSAVLVANMLNTLFTQQIPQIGIMKAVGARSARIGRFYLAMTFLVAVSATLLALVPAIFIGRAGLQQFLGFLGVQPVSVAPPWWAYLVVLAVGLGFPPLMALIPLTKTARTTVRAAIDHRGIGSKPSGATGMLARLTRFGRLDRGLLLALRNTFRRPARFWLSVGLLASGGVVFVAGMSLGASVGALAEEQQEQRNWDVEVQLAGMVPADETIGLAAKTLGVTEVEGWLAVETGVAGPGTIPLTRTYPDQGHGRISLVAIPDDTRMFTPPRLLEGRWLDPGETGAVVINQITRNDTVPDVTAGDTVQLLTGGTPTTWTVIGIVQERGAHGGVYTTQAGFAEATGTPPVANQLRIVTEGHDERTRNTVAAAVSGAFEDAGINVQSAVSVSRSEAITEGHLGPIIVIIVAIAVAMGMVGGIGLASTMSANVLDRTREFGVMHAVGAKPKTVRRIVRAEGIFLALASLLVAIIPALALTGILGAGLGNLFMDAPLPYRISTLAIVIWLVLVVFGSALATDTAANRASHMTVREALAYL
jgi:putative ABC transport system permease protein